MIIGLMMHLYSTQKTFKEASECFTEVYKQKANTIKLKNNDNTI